MVRYGIFWSGQLHVFTMSTSHVLKEGLNGWWLLPLSAKILALLRLSVNFFQLRFKRTKQLKINFFCFKE